MPDRSRATARGGILGGPVDATERLAAQLPAVEARPGLPVLHRASGFLGTVVILSGDAVVVRGTTGLEKRFRNRPGDFAVDGRPARLVPPSSPPSVDPAGASTGSTVERRRVSATERTASGSRAVLGARARVARASRILVEGVHDAELVEKVWGDDLRVEGIVVERLDGADHLAEEVRSFAPGPGRRLGVLLDHLVAGSKEARLADAVRDPHVLVTGTPYVDVWEAIRPVAVGIDSWPVVPKGRDWKTGVCAALGVDDPRTMWRRLLGAVHDWKQLEQPFVAAVEQLIDFVT